MADTFNIAELVALIKTRAIGIDPDDQDFALEDCDWLVIVEALTAAENARKAEPVGWAPQSHLSHLAEGRANDRPSSAVIHDRSNVEMGWTAALYTTPPQQDDLRKAVIDEAIAIMVARLPLYTKIGQKNAIRECVSSIRALAGGE